MAVLEDSCTIFKAPEESRGFLFMMLSWATAYRVFVPVEKNIQVRVLLLKLLDLVQDLGKAHVGRLVENDVYLLLHVPSPVPVPCFCYWDTTYLNVIAIVPAMIPTVCDIASMAVLARFPCRGFLAMTRGIKPNIRAKDN